MKKTLLAAVAVAALFTTTLPSYAQSPDDMDGPGSRTRKPLQIKTRLDHFSGTRWVLVVSYVPYEITSITCEKWTMLGLKSYNDQNNFTIPIGPAIAVMDANKFDGYCATAGSIVAHTDDGDFVGVLDGGAGNWKNSTKLTFSYVKAPK